MKKNWTWLLLLMSTALAAQQYNVALIPDSLRKGAKVVKRIDETELEIKSPGRATVREHHVYTIFDESANSYGQLITFYGAFNTISSVTATLYDEAGNKIKRVKKSDMEDFAYEDGFSLAGDERYKKFDFYCRKYPYTVEIEEEDEFKGILHFQDWQPVASAGMSLELSRYIINAPEEYKVRYKATNCAIQPSVIDTKGRKVYTWEMRNVPTGTTETMSPSWAELTPRVMMAPSDFEAQGYSGNMDSWENYGKFIYQLLKSRDVLPADIKKKVHELTDTVADKRKKVCVLYNFLQQTTHYISVQLGIGGWQPFDAAYVASKRYGDCKALSNYMVALLKESGIDAKYVEIRAGADAPSMSEDFPSFQSNHATVCVPMGKDSMWLECTDQSAFPGYAGTFTGNRKAILIDENGGHVVRTPMYGVNENTTLRNVKATIDAEGNLDASVHSAYTGVCQELPHNIIHDLSKEDQQKYLNGMFSLPTYTIDRNTYEERSGLVPEVDENLHLVSPNYANISGKRLFVIPDIFDKNELRFLSDSNRRFDVVNKHAFKHIDTITLAIPQGYHAEAVPATVKVNTKFGKYTSETKVLPDQITYYREYEQYSGRFPKADYADVVKFYDQVYRADRAKVVLVKNNP